MEERRGHQLGVTGHFYGGGGVRILFRVFPPGSLIILIVQKGVQIFFWGGAVEERYPKEFEYLPIHAWTRTESCVRKIIVFFFLKYTK